MELKLENQLRSTKLRSLRCLEDDLFAILQPCESAQFSPEYSTFESSNLEMVSGRSKYVESYHSRCTPTVLPIQSDQTPFTTLPPPAMTSYASAACHRNYSSPAAVQSTGNMMSTALYIHNEHIFRVVLRFSNFVRGADNKRQRTNGNSHTRDVVTATITTTDTNRETFYGIGPQDNPTGMQQHQRQQGTVNNQASRSKRRKLESIQISVHFPYFRHVWSIGAKDLVMDCFGGIYEAACKISVKTAHLSSESRMLAIRLKRRIQRTISPNGGRATSKGRSLTTARPTADNHGSHYDHSLHSPEDMFPLTIEINCCNLRNFSAAELRGLATRIANLRTWTYVGPLFTIFRKARYLGKLTDMKFQIRDDEEIWAKGDRETMKVCLLERVSNDNCSVYLARLFCQTLQETFAGFGLPKRTDKAQQDSKSLLSAVSLPTCTFSLSPPPEVESFSARGATVKSKVQVTQQSDNNFEFGRECAARGNDVECLNDLVAYDTKERNDKQLANVGYITFEFRISRHFVSDETILCLAKNVMEFRDTMQQYIRQTKVNMRYILRQQLHATTNGPDLSCGVDLPSN